MVDAAGKLMDDNGNWPAKGSTALDEFAAFPGLEAAETCYSQVGLALASAGDNMFALQRVLAEPMMTFTPWVLARAVLESTATASWLLDPNAGLTTRISRSMSLRLRQLRDQAAFGRQAIKENWRSADKVRGIPSHVEGRVEAILANAANLGVETKHDRKGNVVGFGGGLPSATELAERLGEGSTYRLFSGLAHGRMWAQLGLAIRVTQGRRRAVEQHITPQGVLIITMKCADWFCKPVWDYFHLSGWNIDPLKAAFEDGYDALKVKRERRFWLH